jgi:hypothetical protein
MPQANSSISNFKRFFLKMLLPLVVIVGGISYGFTHWFERKIILGSEICGAYKVNRMLTESRPNEIPIFGSSRAECAFDPELLGPDFFNYGMSGTQEDVTLLMIAAECKKVGKRSPMILLNFDLDGINSFTGDIANYLYNSDDPDVRRLMHHHFRHVHHVPVVKYYGYFELYTKYYLNARLQFTKHVSRGASMEKNAIPAAKFQELVQERSKTRSAFHNAPVLTEAWMQVLRDHPERFFVFVISPNHASYYAQYENLQDANAFLAELDALPNAEVLDFGRVDYPDSLYLNTTHLNYAGAKVFNRALRDSLDALELRAGLPSSR